MRRSVREEAEPKTEWDHLDLVRFCVFTVINFTLMKAALYPLWLIKTRLQAQHGWQHYSGIWDALAKISRREGLRGFYRGFPVTAIGFIPAQLAYNLCYEWTRAHLPSSLARHDDQVRRNLLGGAAASFASSLVSVPLDVVAQRLMMEPRGAAGKYRGGLHGLRVVWQMEGVSGLYRGFWLSIRYAHRQAKGLVRSPNADLLVTGLCGSVAGMTSALLTNPIDVLKTRLQLHEGSPARAGRLLFSVAQTLWREEGLRGLTKGLSARLASSSIVSVVIITTYEGVKRLSWQQPAHAPRPAAAPRHAEQSESGA